MQCDIGMVLWPILGGCQLVLFFTRLSLRIPDKGWKKRVVCKQLKISVFLIFILFPLFSTIF
jgi:hypothetical protein